MRELIVCALLKLELLKTDYFNNHNFSTVQTISSLMMIVKLKHVGALLM
jgi:hypothetical protein